MRLPISGEELAYWTRCCKLTPDVLPLIANKVANDLEEVRVLLPSTVASGLHSALYEAVRRSIFLHGLDASFCYRLSPAVLRTLNDAFVRCLGLRNALDPQSNMLRMPIFLANASKLRVWGGVLDGLSDEVSRMPIFLANR